MPGLRQGKKKGLVCRFARWIPDRDGKEQPEHLLLSERRDCLTPPWHAEGLVGYGGIVSANTLVAKLREEPLIDTHWPEEEKWWREKVWKALNISTTATHRRKRQAMGRWGRKQMCRRPVILFEGVTNFLLPILRLYTTAPFVLGVPALFDSDRQAGERGDTMQRRAQLHWNASHGGLG